MMYDERFLFKGVMIIPKRNFYIMNEWLNNETLVVVLEMMNIATKGN